jgi:peroxiredoxin
VTVQPASSSSSTVPARLVQVLFVVVAAVVVWLFTQAVRDGEHRRSPDVLVRYLRPQYTGDNRTAPDFELQDRNGRTVHLADYRGRVVVLHFWTRTCGPCVEELQRSLPAFDELVRERRDMALVLVTIDSSWQAIAPLVPAGFTSPILFDPSRRVVSGRYGTRMFPETWIIDRQGVIRARFDHELDWGSAVLVNYLASL